MNITKQQVVIQMREDEEMKICTLLAWLSSIEDSCYSVGDSLFSLYAPSLNICGFGLSPDHWLVTDC